MTKKELARTIAEALDIRQTEVQEIIQRVFDGITDTLVEEGRIELRNFGVFQVKKRKPRKAHNPRTLEKLKVPARMVVTFKPGREMENRIGQLKQVPTGKE